MTLDLSEGNYRAGNTVKEGYLLNTPLQAAFIDANDGVLADNYTMIRCDRENVLIETIKKAEECWNVRSSLLKLWMVR